MRNYWCSTVLRGDPGYAGLFSALGQPVLSLLKRERKLGTRDAGGHPCSLGNIDDRQPAVIVTLAHLVQTIALDLGRASNALLDRKSTRLNSSHG